MSMPNLTSNNFVPAAGIGVINPEQLLRSSNAAAYLEPRQHPIKAALYAVSRATSLAQCWHHILFFAAWATCISFINHSVKDVTIQPTLLTVMGTVLGFVISYRTTSSFERYNEGRRLWSQIVLNCRNFARTVFPDGLIEDSADPSADGKKTERVVIEKMTTINLLLAFAISTKHYLRREVEDIYYEDLYHLVKFLPPYSLPTTVPAQSNTTRKMSSNMPAFTNISQSTSRYNTARTAGVLSSTKDSLNPPAPSRETKRTSLVPPTEPSAPVPMRVCESTGPIQISPVNSTSSMTPRHPQRSQFPHPLSTQVEHEEEGSSITAPSAYSTTQHSIVRKVQVEPVTHGSEQGEKNLLDIESNLRPARRPSALIFANIFPSFVVNWVRQREQGAKDMFASRSGKKMDSTSQNLPLEITFYLSSYISALQARKVLDAPTTTALLTSVSLLVDALTGLERILTTPIPFSYSVHLWIITVIYCLLLPFQLWASFKWLTIPATAILTFVFFGFLAAGEEIEDPFGYHPNDLDLDHFTTNIIRTELAAITSTPPPDVSSWAFAPANDRVLTALHLPSQGGVQAANPEKWVSEGETVMRKALIGC